MHCKPERVDWERASKSTAAEAWDRAGSLKIGQEETARTVLVPNRQHKQTSRGEPEAVHGPPDRLELHAVNANRYGRRRQTLFAGRRFRLRPPDRPGSDVSRLTGSLKKFVSLNDRLRKLGHGNAAILALPLKQPERFIFVQVAAGHENALGASMSFRSRRVTFR